MQLPDKQNHRETDQNPRTEYEDTTAHPRTGFITNEDGKRLDPLLKNPPDDFLD